MIVVITGLVAIAALAGVAMWRTDGEMEPLVTAAFGVIGAIVSAFFGIHAGAGMAQREAERTKAQMMSTMTDEQKKDFLTARPV